MGGYFDHNATTPLDPRVLEAMIPWLSGRHGNPSSAHAWGREASAAVEEAREQVAYLIGARARDVVFTGSGSEANNAVIGSYAGVAGRIASSSFEHPSVLRALEDLRNAGAEIEWVDPGPDGVCSPESWSGALERKPALAVLMLANNEIGTLQPVAEVAAQARERGVPLLTDAVQAVGKVAVAVDNLGADYLVLGGHKFHAPLGSAAVWVRPGVRWRPLIRGGSQESGRRASTVNVPAVVGLGEACRLAADELGERNRKMRELRDRFEATVGEIDGVTIHGAGAERLPNTSSVAFGGVAAQNLMIRLDMAGFAVSMGSACGSGKLEPSATLRAIGVDAETTGSTLRFSFAATNTAEEVEALSAAVTAQVEALRGRAGAA